MGRGRAGTGLGGGLVGSGWGPLRSLGGLCRICITQ